jgi:hypothetical protein
MHTDDTDVELHITDEDGTDATVKKLTDAKQSKQSKLTFYNMHLPDELETENVIRAALDLFRHSSAHGRLWEHLELSWSSGCIAEIVIEAISLDLFSEISLIGIDEDDTPLLPIFMALSAGMKSNSRLEKIQLSELDVSSLHMMAALKEGLISANSYFKELILEELRFDSFSEEECVSELEAGLQGNKGLLTLHITACNLEDAQLAQLADALVSHLSLRELSFADNVAGPDVFKALAKLLTNSKLESLNLENQIGEHGIVASHVALLAKGLESNQHLKVLNLSNNHLDDQALEDLTRTVWTCSKLEELDITHNSISDKGLQMIASHVLPSSLRCLGLGFNSLTREGASHLLKILQDNAQLGAVRLGSYELPLSPEIEHLLDFNQAGRVLLGQGHSVPLSLWPVVLERANQMFKYSRDGDRERKRANVVFLLLQGPALIQRRFREVIDSEKNLKRSRTSAET